MWHLLVRSPRRDGDLVGDGHSFVNTRESNCLEFPLLVNHAEAMRVSFALARQND